MKTFIRLFVFLCMMISVSPFQTKAEYTCGYSPEYNQATYDDPQELVLGETTSFKRCTDYDNYDDDVYGYYIFTLPSRGYIEFSGENYDVDGEILDVDYEIYDLNGDLVGSYKSEYLDILENGNINFKFGLDKGIYQLKINYENMYSIGEYNHPFIINFIPSNNYEIEFNDTNEYATPLVINEPMTGFFGGDNLWLDGEEYHWYSDYDTYKVTVNNDGKYRLSYSRDWPNYPTSSSIDFYLTYSNNATESFGESTFQFIKNSNGDLYLDLNLKKGINYITLSNNDYNYHGTYYNIKLSPVVIPDLKTKFTLNNILPYSTLVTGKAEPGSLVKVFKGKTMIGQSTTSKGGNFSVKIPKQPIGTSLNIRNTKSGYKEYVQSVKIYNYHSSLTNSNITSNTTSISGITTPSSKVDAYVGNNLIGTTTSNSKGFYKITISKQKAGTNVTITVSKTNYFSRSKIVQVTN